MLVSALVVFAAVAAVVERHWLGGRTVWVVALAAAVLSGLWGVAGIDRRWGAAGAAILSCGIAVVVATDLQRVEDGFSARVLATDIPPRAVYAIAFAAGLACLGCIGLALWAGRRLDRSQSGPGSGPEPEPEAGPAAGLVGAGGRRAVAGGLLVAAVVVPLTILAGGVTRDAADRRAEAATLERTVRRPAERVAELGGPSRPGEQVWQVDQPPAPIQGTHRSVAAVPGWDVVLVHQLLDTRRTSRLVALSTRDGRELWRYERRGAFSVTADPASGRVLLGGRAAVVVLSLEDGEELTTTRLPEDLSCGGSLGPGPSAASVALPVGPVALVGCERGEGDAVIMTIDVRTGRSRGTGDLPDHGTCFVDAAPTVTPALALWWGPGCGPPTLVTADPDAGRIEPVEVSPPAGRSAQCPDYCFYHLAAGDELAVATLSWPRPTGEESDREWELVAFSPDGELRWRVPADSDLPVVAVTEHGVVTRDDDTWRLLSLEDGRELVRRPFLDDRPERGRAVSDGRLLYVVGDAGAEGAEGADSTGISVRRVEDLAPLGTWPDAPGVEVGEPFPTDGHLIYWTGGYRLVAYGDPSAG